MNSRIRGLVYLVGFLLIAALFCGVIPFVVMPGAGFGVALPVIEVPGEVIVEDWLPGFNLTNTIVGTVLADIIVFIYVFLAWRASKGWTQEIPNRLQGLVEVFIESIYGFFRGLAGDKLRTTPMLWPLVATIFIFLLTANWMKLLPGVETFGYMHCAHVGQSGYPMIDGWNSTSYRLWVDAPLDSGTRQTEEGEHACEVFFKEDKFGRYPADDTVVVVEAQLEEAEIALEEAQASLAALLPEEAATDTESEAGEEAEAEAEAVEEDEAVVDARTEVEKAEREVERQQIRLVSAGAIPTLESSLEETEALIEAIDGEEGLSIATPDFMDDLRDAATGRHFPDMIDDLEADVIAAVADVEAAVAAGDAEAYESALVELQAAQQELLNYDYTQMQFPTATLIFTQDQLENTEAFPFSFHITPFVRGAATDLSLTFALAIMSVVLVQVYGVWALGPAYFEKFINLGAIGNAGKRPLGLIDFIVGLIEIISEIGKIISLAFRLFGNLFAGGIALIAVTFLVAMIIPGVIVGLEIIIGGVQALVFAVLTLVFTVQAMEGHHGDDHEHGDHAEEHH